MHFLNKERGGALTRSSKSCKMGKKRGDPAAADSVALAGRNPPFSIHENKTVVNVAEFHAKCKSTSIEACPEIGPPESEEPNKGVTYTAENVQRACQPPPGRARTPTFGKKEEISSHGPSSHSPRITARCGLPRRFGRTCRPCHAFALTVGF